MPPITLTQYKPGDLVSVRSASPTWWPGVVTAVDSAKIAVSLNAPYPTGSQWSGQTLRYGGNQPVTSTIVWIAAETVSQGQGKCSHIQPRS